MAWQIIPTSPAPDNTMSVVVEVNGQKIPLLFRFRFNVVGKYWFLDVSNAINGSMYLSGVPLVTGEYPAADLLEQFHYLGIGKALIAKMTDTPPTEIPDDRNLGVEFALAWGDDSEPVGP